MLGIFENFIPLPIPAVRIGLANMPIMVMLYLAPIRYAVVLMLLKSFLVPIFSGNFIFKLSLGFPSTAIAFIFMVLMMKLMRDRVSAVSVGVVGAFTHMFTQLVIADAIYVKGILSTSMVGVLLLISVVTGVITGLITLKLIGNRNMVTMFHK